ncbi:YncE family protein [Candidatus Palauibacter sp.]|uniref:YncE family protein n=1 Tax=Candidatus Palauibacter sp. TaxID=3101350 RepID=UPI003B027EEF
MRRRHGRPVPRAAGPGATPRRLAALAPVLLAAACGPSPDRPNGDAPRLYVTSGFTDEVHVLDARDGEILRTISIDRRRTETDEPHGVTVSRDGRHWYATLAHGHPTLWKYETDGDRLVGRLQLDIPGAARVGLTPDGGRAFIPDYWRGGLGEESRVAVVDVHDLTVAAVPVVCPAPHHAAVDPAGTRVAVTCSLSDEIVLMDAGSAATLARFPAGPERAEARYTPMNAAWSPDGARFHVTMAGTGEVRAFSRTGDPEGVAAVGRGPAQIAGSEDGRVLVVANRLGGSVSVLDPAGPAEVRRIELPGEAFPHGVALDPAGEIAYVTWEGRVGEYGGVTALRIDTGEVLWRREVGVLTLGVAYLAGRTASGS